MLVHIYLKYWVKFVLGWIRKKLYISGGQLLIIPKMPIYIYYDIS